MAFAVLQPAREKLYEQLQPDGALSLLQPLMAQTSNMPDDERRALRDLQGSALMVANRYLEAAQVYGDGGNDYMAGYCALLGGDLYQTQTHWTRLYHIRHSHWGITLYGLVTRTLNLAPSFLQVRNHLEADVYNFIQAGQTMYLENVLSYVDILTQMNLEAPKFMGRALMHAGWLHRAEHFLMKGQKALPNDPEIYYHLGQYNAKVEKYEDARLMLHQCLLISPTYTPAKELLQEIREHLA